VFFAERNTRKVPGLSAGAKGAIASGAVIGAGTMGGGIAICFANAGLPVTVLDSSQEALDRGIAVIGKTYDSMVKRGRLSAQDKERRLALIRGTLDYADLTGADVVIEAVFESLDLKRKIFKALDEVAKARRSARHQYLDARHHRDRLGHRRPEDVIGLHFFSPANVMPLLEIVRADATAPAIIASALDLARTLRKTPVLARVCYGFIGNRMMEGYAREAQRMVLEGATPAQVDGALEAWGLAMGILAYSTWRASMWESMCIEPTPTDIRRIPLIIRRILRCMPRADWVRKAARVLQVSARRSDAARGSGSDRHSQGHSAPPRRFTKEP